MRGKILLFLTLSGLWSLSSCAAVRKFHYVTEKKNWAEAQSYCRKTYDDLASLLNMEDVSNLLKNPELHMDRLHYDGSGSAWIGLSNDRDNWTWSLNSTGHHRNTDFTNWAKGEPNAFTQTQICAKMDTSGQWWDGECTGKSPSVCYNGSAYFVQATQRSWFEAQEYCRDEYMDLASVMDETENTEIAKKLSRWTWIGLYRKPWAYWSEQLSVSFTHWAEENAQHQMRLKVRISSGADMNDPEVQRQLLQQMHAMLEKQGMSDFKLRWTQKDGNIFHKEPKKKN